MSACRCAIIFAIFVCRKIFVGGVSWDTKKGSEHFAFDNSYITM